jgi:predicted tellurium resistance membrane protein TerC
MEWLAWVTQPEAWVALVALTAIEIVLGIDNIIFLSILVSRLPPQRQPQARLIGLALAMLMRIALLLSLTWLMRLTAPLFTVLGEGFSGRDLILLAGGLFLLAKSTLEIHDSLEGQEGHGQARVHATFAAVIVQVVLLDIVFSIDSVLTAIGMAQDVAVMVIAVVIAVGVMMVAAGAIHRFIERHPTFKMLALAFLVLVGVALVGEGLGMHIPRGYVYFAMAFSAGVEVLNMRLRGRAAAPVHLRSALRDGGPEAP